MATQDGETQLTLRINLETDPITGSLSSAQGPNRRFAGWIGLAAALEAIRTELLHVPKPQTEPPTTTPVRVKGIGP
jgi:hypothetical protein